MSDRRTLANRTNASKSTGPKSKDGKSVVSSNATRHGIFSDRLFLHDEDPAEFNQLLLELQESLLPVGSLELGLIERIAVNMWRQRRLIAAETASISLARERKKIAKGVSSELDLAHAMTAVDENDLEPFDEHQERWCRAVLHEIEQLEDFELKTIEADAPHVFAQLQRDAEEDHEELPAYLDEYEGGAAAYIGELLRWCRKKIADAERRPKLLEMAERVRQQKLMLPERALMLFTRYQTTLDNQIYKALRALRESQEWRLKTIEELNTGEGEAVCDGPQ